MRKWLRRLGIVSALILLSCMGFCGLSGPHELKIREDVTHITGPLDAEGNLDYETALNTKLSEGVRPETNANVLLWQIMPLKER
jgi:hypothetical protein